MYIWKRQRKFVILLATMTIFFIIIVIYQAKALNEFIYNRSNSHTLENKNFEPVLKGVHIKLMPFYRNKNNKFTCIKSMEEIAFDKINDDYCDCDDGSDEPGTNACSNGIFYCTEQSHLNHCKNLIQSYRVNDGVCDCCDGSDEYIPKKIGAKSIKCEKSYEESHRSIL